MRLLLTFRQPPGAPDFLTRRIRFAKQQETGKTSDQRRQCNGA